MRITRAVVPSLFTILNIFCGFLSIVNAHEGHIQNAAWFIILAGIFDSLDGLMARITRSSSQFGVELDSLADVISFGAAPSFMIYNAHLFQMGNLGILITAFPLFFGAVRLARFNVQLVGFDKDFFFGLPIPAQAITLCAFVLEYYSEFRGVPKGMAPFVLPGVILLSVLMVTRIKYDTLPKFTKKDARKHPVKIVLVVAAGLLLIFSKGKLFFEIMSAYVLFGILRASVTKFRQLLFVHQKQGEKRSQISSIDI